MDSIILANQPKIFSILPYNHEPMRKSFLITLGVISTLSLHAHTCYPDTVYCPVDSHKVVFCVTMSMTTFGSYYDFQKKGALGNHYEELINGCPNCHYCGYLRDFKTSFSRERKDSVLSILEKYKNLELTDAIECEITAAVRLASGGKYDEIADIYLLGSYLLRKDKNNIGKRKQMQLLSCEYFQKAIDDNEYKNEEVATINYLIGDLYRRVGDFEKATLYFDKSLSDKNKKDWLEKIIKEQKELVSKRDDNNDI